MNTSQAIRGHNRLADQTGVRCYRLRCHQGTHYRHCITGKSIPGLLLSAMLLVSPASPLVAQPEQDAALDRRIAELENQLALGQEAAERARIETVELETRLTALEQQIAAAETAIQQQDLQLAQLQQSIARAAAEAAAAEPTPATAGAAITDRATTAANLLDNIIGWSAANPLLALVGLLLVLLGLSWLLRRNRSMPDQPDTARKKDLPAPASVDQTRQSTRQIPADDSKITAISTTKTDMASATQEPEPRLHDEPAEQPEPHQPDQSEQQGEDQQHHAATEAAAQHSESAEKTHQEQQRSEVEPLPDEETQTPIGTKLELAYAYQQMGDTEGVRKILAEVIAEGNEQQVKEAEKLLKTLDTADNPDTPTPPVD